MFKPIKHLAPNNYDPKEWSEANVNVPVGESLTIQSQADEADINVMMERFKLTGQMPDDARPVFFADFEDIFDFQSAHNAVIKAQRAFDDLPAQVRSRFGNSPQAYVEFCSDPANLPEMRSLGLAKPLPEAPQAPISTPPATPVAAPPKTEP